MEERVSRRRRRPSCSLFRWIERAFRVIEAFRGLVGGCGGEEGEVKEEAEAEGVRVVGVVKDRDFFRFVEFSPIFPVASFLSLPRNLCSAIMVLGFHWNAISSHFKSMLSEAAVEVFVKVMRLEEGRGDVGGGEGGGGVLYPHSEFLVTTMSATDERSESNIDWC